MMRIVSGVPLQTVDKEVAKQSVSSDVLSLKVAHVKFLLIVEVASTILLANGVLKILLVSALTLLAQLLNQFTILQLLAHAISTEIAAVAELDQIASGV